MEGEKIIFMNKGGTADLGVVKISLVPADHSSSCGFSGDTIYDGGAAAGWVIRFSLGNEDYSIYHAGDTGIFGDMELINELYEPTHVLLPIGDKFTMGPEAAALAVDKYFKKAKTFYPMHYGTWPRVLTGTFAELKK